MNWIETFEPGAVERVEELGLDALAPGRHRLALRIVEDGMARPQRLPVIVVKGHAPGPVVGITAAVHGNELNGIRVIHRLLRTMDPKAVRGTVVGATIVNVPGFLRHERRMPDDRDLNRIFPGRIDGNESDVYAYRLTEKLISKFEVLLDLHTASFGRINSYYVRADMEEKGSADLARAVGAEIIVHNEGTDGTLRACAAERGIAAITIEIGDPQVIDRGKVRESRVGVRDALEAMGIVDPDDEQAARKAIECRKSYWLYTDTGGILEVIPGLAERVEAGQVVGHLVDPWGQRLRTYHAPESGVVVGKSTNPVASTGSRILHLGIE